MMLSLLIGCSVVELVVLAEDTAEGLLLPVSYAPRTISCRTYDT
jgi:hypothetical protein